MPYPAQSTLGIYVSIPFCRSKCTYCNFASGVYSASEHEHYIERALADLRGAGEWGVRMDVELPRRVDTIYLGGGTPTLLAPALLARLVAAIRSEFDVDPGAEFTVECAPGQLADETLNALIACGVNRVSLGVQSFVDREAAVSGRLHHCADVVEDLRRLRAAGIANINVDLIAGLAGQTAASWEESLAALIGSDVPHASVYMLEVDENSRLGRELLARGSRYFAGLVPSDDAVARMYSSAIEQLSAAGRSQYEISNFARPGFASRHNLRYWRRRPYLGLGLDASSALPSRPAHGLPFDARPRPVLRSTTTSDLKAYLDGQCEREIEWLSSARQHEEAWFLGLRLSSGVNIREIEREFGSEMLAQAMSVVDRMTSQGLLSFDGATVWLTARGKLLSNEVFQEFIELEPALPVV